MKKYLPLLAAALTLTACSTAPESTPAPMQTPAAENATGEESAAAFPIGERCCAHITTGCTAQTQPITRCIAKRAQQILWG